MKLSKLAELHSLPVRGELFIDANGENLRSLRRRYRQHLTERFGKKIWFSIELRPHGLLITNLGEPEPYQPIARKHGTEMSRRPLDPGRTLMKNGQWLVPEEERPEDWEVFSHQRLTTDDI